MTLIPAYGQNYKNKSEAQAGLDAGSYFVIANDGKASGLHVNKAHLLWSGARRVNIRFNGRRAGRYFSVR